jgi:hypothetical protein
VESLIVELKRLGSTRVAGADTEKLHRAIERAIASVADLRINLGMVNDAADVVRQKLGNP